MAAVEAAAVEAAAVEAMAAAKAMAAVEVKAARPEKAVVATSAIKEHIITPCYHHMNIGTVNVHMLLCDLLNGRSNTGPNS
jgi:hypothetical protein